MHRAPTLLRPLAALPLLLSLPLSLADEAPPGPTPLEAAIPPGVAALEAPEPFDFRHPLRVAVSTASEEAQAHVRQGFAHLHGGWDFEARRHFAAALEEDPGCLTAHAGIVFTMLSVSPETLPARSAALDRLLDLLEAEAGTELERGQAYALVRYLEDGPRAASAVFQSVSERFPNDLQSAAFAALFGRAGYGEDGRAMPDQEVAERRLEALIERHPGHPLPIHALLVIRAEAPDLRESLPLARQLVALQPDYPPYLHLLGHYEWRCGEAARAVDAFSQAAAGWRNWKEAGKVPLADCPDLVRTLSYLAVARHSAGDFDTALAEARELAAIAPDPERRTAAGTRMLLWEARSLPARLLMARGNPGDAAAALASLPTAEATEPFEAYTLAQWWTQGLAQILRGHAALDEGDLGAARSATDAMVAMGERMATLQNHASAAGERSFFHSSFLALESATALLRARIANSEAPRATSFNWLRSAADRQRPASLLMPPALLVPAARELGDLWMALERPGDAADAYLESFTRFPSDPETPARLLAALDAAGRDEEAAALRARIGEP